MQKTYYFYRMKNIIILLFFLSLFSCSKEIEHPFGFYYWKTKLSLNKEEGKALEQSKIPQLYTRFFDIDKIGNQFQPIGVISKDSTFTTDKKIVPVVFITNKTFLNIKKEEISFLAKSTYQLIQKKIKDLNLTVENEIQIDCDWTAGTKEDYFLYLKELEKISKKNITSTLRLHQVKDKELMGVPPVKKVYLMCYSTSSPLDDSDKNSILDNDLLKKYLKNLDNYPLKNIDIALPIYSWGIVTNHLGKHKLIGGVSTEDFNSPNFRPISRNEYKILKDDFYFGHFLNKGFTIKVEEIPASQLNNALEFINTKIKNYNVIYYHLDKQFIKNINLTR